MSHKSILVAFVSMLVLFGSFLSPPGATSGGGTFTVNSPGDASDSNPGDCLCSTSGGVCTLRAAIEEANACAGPQTIQFAQAMTISPATALPALTDDGTIIDASNQWVADNGHLVPGVVLDGNNGSFSGLDIRCSNCNVRGLQVMRFGQYGIVVQGNATGSVIGGSSFYQRNVISRNGWDGILITGANATDNLILSNYVGTNPAGTADSWDGVSDWGNGHHGISVWYGDRNEVNGNYVGANGWSGITVDAAQYITVTLNSIGVDWNGQSSGNTYYGVHIGNGAQDVDIIGNSIAFNQRGVYVAGTNTRATIENNSIYSNTATSLSTPMGGGVFVTDGGGATILSNYIFSNTAQYGGGIAVSGSTAWAGIYSNIVQDNTALADGGGVYVEDGLGWISDNDIVENTAGGAGGGISFNSAGWSFIVSNRIGGNASAWGGVGIAIRFGDILSISGNEVVSNRGGLGAIEVLSANKQVRIEENRIQNNSGGGGGGAVAIVDSGEAVVENNVIARNSYRAGLMVNGPGGWITSTNNTIVSNVWDGIYLYNADLALFNTIVASNGSYGLYVGGSWTLWLAANDVWGNGAGASNDGSIPFDMEQDPRFFDAANDQYGLRPGSPCIDAADPTYAPSDSYNGLSRPQGTGPDIGAYEMAMVDLPLVLRNH